MSVLDQPPKATAAEYEKFLQSSVYEDFMMVLEEIADGLEKEVMITAPEGLSNLQGQYKAVGLLQELPTTRLEELRAYEAEQKPQEDQNNDE